MSGRRIDDHNSWLGGGTFPDGARMRSISDVEGAGELMRYQDTEDKIAEMQRKNVSKAEAHKTKEGYRN